METLRHIKGQRKPSKNCHLNEVSFFINKQQKELLDRVGANFFLKKWRPIHFCSRSSVLPTRTLRLRTGRLDRLALGEFLIDRSVRSAGPRQATSPTAKPSQQNGGNIFSSLNKKKKTSTNFLTSSLPRTSTAFLPRFNLVFYFFLDCT